MIDQEHWDEAQVEEVDWWGNCVNTYHEEEKQFVYARYMGLTYVRDERSPYTIPVQGKRILDIGAGPCSLILKTTALAEGVVIDPCPYPEWVGKRYKAAGVELIRTPAEELTHNEVYDEVWMYNVLQHTIDPEKIVEKGIKALKPGGRFRVFEWVNTPTNTAHPHSLTKELLDGWFGRDGDLVSLAESGCHGLAWYGAFTYEGN
jgi:2-polyprenyl-3-methyl-5-hydroxy-6-metoxy-1,4-benzoquinol methylase